MLRCASSRRASQGAERDEVDVVKAATRHDDASPTFFFGGFLDESALAESPRSASEAPALSSHASIVRPRGDATDVWKTSPATKPLKLTKVEITAWRPEARRERVLIKIERAADDEEAEDQRENGRQRG